MKKIVIAACFFALPFVSGPAFGAHTADHTCPEIPSMKERIENNISYPEFVEILRCVSQYRINFPEELLQPPSGCAPQNLARESPMDYIRRVSLCKLLGDPDDYTQEPDLPSAGTCAFIDASKCETETEIPK